jgi:DNA mismatch endonuclease, patch repair protein
MTDRITKVRRSWNMSRIRAKGTGPERAVWHLLRSLGYRPQVNRDDLPGTPDLVLPRKRVTLFINGCFWHRHSGCKFAYTPKSNRRFWNEKFRTNVKRDRRVRQRLRSLGWQYVVVWECELADRLVLKRRLRRRILSLTHRSASRQGSPSGRRPF